MHGLTLFAWRHRRTVLLAPILSCITGCASPSSLPRDIAPKTQSHSHPVLDKVAEALSRIESLHATIRGDHQGEWNNGASMSETTHFTIAYESPDNWRIDGLGPPVTPGDAKSARPFHVSAIGSEDLFRQIDPVRGVTRYTPHLLPELIYQRPYADPVFNPRRLSVVAFLKTLTPREMTVTWRGDTVSQFTAVCQYGELSLWIERNSFLPVRFRAVRTGQMGSSGTLLKTEDTYDIRYDRVAFSTSGNGASAE